MSQQCCVGLEPAGYASLIKPGITGEGILSEMNAIQQADIIGMYNVFALVAVQVRQVRICSYLLYIKK